LEWFFIFKRSGCPCSCEENYKTSVYHHIRDKTALLPLITGKLRLNIQINISTFEKKTMKKIFSVLILCLSILSFAQSQTPFTGKRDFNIETGEQGSGAPSYYLEVKSNGDVHFGSVQVDPESGKEKKEVINAGKYNPKVMKVHFKTYHETLYVKFDKKNIYLTDANGNIKKSDDCCPETGEKNCNCKSILYQ